MDQKKQNLFRDNRPGKKWFESFLKRHPNLVEKTAENLTKARDGVKETDVINWFQEIEQYLEQNNLKDIVKDPNRVFNADESAFFFVSEGRSCTCKERRETSVQFMW